MSTVKTVPAFSDSAKEWHRINWRQAHQRVRGLQVRIAKATKERRWRRVKALQRLLTRSFAAKVLAVRRVTENRGKRTPGVDKELWSTPLAKWQAIDRLKRTGYCPQPLRRVYIAKADGKRRPLGIPTMRDRAMQALYLLALDPVSETLADRHSYGFRPKRSTADAIEQCFVALSRKNSAEWALEGDIQGCFDNISHEWLLNHIPMDKEVLRKWLKAGYLESTRLFPTESGTPQGGIASPVLTNMALDGLEARLLAQFGQKNSKASSRTKVNYVRYADDFVITGISKELLAEQVKPLVEAFMAERGLKLSAHKTVITHIGEGFDFLGQNLRKYGDKLLIKPSRQSLRKHLQKLKEIVKRNRMTTQTALIQQLNPIIRGWANYHRHVVSKETFSYVDYRLWKLLWRWCCRRHKNRRKQWVKLKYFHTLGNNHWSFQSIDTTGRRVTLLRSKETPIKRHIKIVANANPYDPKEAGYFEKRLTNHWKETRLQRGQVRTLWERQNHRCALCHQLFQEEDEWDVHHIIHRRDEGSDEPSNLMMLHPNCHRQLHHGGKSGAGPSVRMDS